MAQIARLAVGLTRFLARHPLADLTADPDVTGVAADAAGPAPSLLAAVIAAVAVVWRLALARLVHPAGRAPGAGRWRRWHYQRHWTAVMTIGRLAPRYRGRMLLPVLGKVTSTGYTDRVQVRLVSGQSPADFARRADNLAHGFGALICRVRTARPGSVVLELVRRDALAAIIPALPIPGPPGPAGAAGRPPRGRHPVADPPARHPPAASPDPPAPGRAR